jgi:hypothetical protein
VSWEYFPQLTIAQAEKFRQNSGASRVIPISEFKKSSGVRCGTKLPLRSKVVRISATRTTGLARPKNRTRRPKRKGSATTGPSYSKRV